MIIQEILKWSQSLPDWQSDAISRLFTKGSLSYNDMEDIFALLKAEHGIPDIQNRTARRFSIDQIPTRPVKDINTKLLSINNLENVNKIANKQYLRLNESGLSIIYGDNGSGKSGYSRVLKKACRARDQHEIIHPDAFDPSAKASKAKATFQVRANGIEQEAIWVDGSPSPEILSNLAVFDSICARSYLDEEGDFAYIPYGLDILESLAQACGSLKAMIEKEQLQLGTIDPVPDIDAKTAVGIFLVGLSHNSKTEELDSLSNLVDVEIARMDELSRILSENNPKIKAKTLKALSGRMEKINTTLHNKQLMLGDDVAEKIKSLTNEYNIYSKAATQDMLTFQEDKSLLPGTGGDSWKELFSAARKFYLEAHPERSFPTLGPDDPCPLCQQPLSTSSELMWKFDKFIQKEAGKKAEEKLRAIKTITGPLSAQNLLLGIDEELYQEISDINRELAQKIRDYESSLPIRRAAFFTAIDTGHWSCVTPLPPDPSPEISAQVKAILDEVNNLEQAGTEESRNELERTLKELEARAKLFKNKSIVTNNINKLKIQFCLKNCLSAVKTNRITSKSSELTEQIVSKKLELSLNDEFKSLGVANLRVCLKSRNFKGRVFHKLVLDIPHINIPAQILSEGEQRAIAIASFLAEVSIGGNTDGIIFDDPVSSLDHKRRELVARRLALEATKRQVIIFTHDIYFVCILLEEANNIGATATTQSVLRKPEGFGVTDPYLPFEGLNTTGRIGFLRNRHVAIRKLYESGDELEHRKSTAEAYQQLRITWERAIEEVLLGKVVLRFRKSIETKRLDSVSVDDSDYAVINKYMSKCSNFAHDQALLGGTAVPDPEELLADIEELEKWRSYTIKKSREVKKQRSN